MVQGFIDAGGVILEVAAGLTAGLGVVQKGITDVWTAFSTSFGDMLADTLYGEMETQGKEANNTLMDTGLKIEKIADAWKKAAKAGTEYTGPTTSALKSTTDAIEKHRQAIMKASIAGIAGEVGAEEDGNKKKEAAAQRRADYISSLDEYVRKNAAEIGNKQLSDRQGFDAEIRASAEETAQAQLDASSKANEAIRAANQETASKWSSGLQMVTGTITDNVFAVIDGSKTMEEAVSEGMITIGKNVALTALSNVINYVVTAAAGAMSAEASIPIVGPILAIAAGAAVLAAGMAMKAKLSKKAMGGYALGGIPNVDSVPVLVKPGIERILNPAESKDYERNGGRGQGQTLNVTVNPPLMSSSSLDYQKMVRDHIVPSLLREAQAGRLRFA
jgi:hypothetical protein